MRQKAMALRSVLKSLVLRAAALLLLTAPVVAPAAAQDEPQQEADPRPDAVVRSGLPIPRFATLRSDEVNLRTGPGVRYPVDWVFVRAGMPVEITAEFDTWRRIRDWEGTQGWVHRSMLVGRRSFVITGDVHTLRREPGGSSPAVAQVEPGVIGRLNYCKGDWCRVEAQGIEGWLRRDEFWGVYPDEEVKD